MYKTPNKVCMYVFMYVCMDGRTDGRTDGWMDVMYVCMYQLVARQKRCLPQTSFTNPPPPPTFQARQRPPCRLTSADRRERCTPNLTRLHKFRHILVGNGQQITPACACNLEVFLMPGGGGGGAHQLNWRPPNHYAQMYVWI